MNKDKCESHIYCVYMFKNNVQKVSIQLFRIKEYLIEMEKTFNGGKTNTYTLKLVK